MRKIITTGCIPGKSVSCISCQELLWGFVLKAFDPESGSSMQKKGEEVRSGNKSILSADSTSYPDIPPRLATCPGPEGPDRPLSPPGREERVCTWKPWKSWPSGACWDCGWPSPGGPPDPQAGVNPYLATASAPGPPCPHPLCPARRAPDAPPASGCAPPSHGHPFAKTKGRYTMVPLCL